MHRRHALRILAGTGTAVALGACSSDDSTPGTRSDATTPRTEPTPNPEADLSLHLWAEPGTAEIAPGVTTDVLSYGGTVLAGDPDALVSSGSYLGPTINVQTGQRLHIVFENRLDGDSIVHWHGLDVPQDQDGQPADAVGPGETYIYDFVVTNPPGTHWYHPHPHGHTGEQVYRGLAGLLIVHGDEPLPDGERDLGIVLQDRTLADDGTLAYVGNHHDQMAGFVGAELVANGTADTRIEVRPEPYRLRLLNGANSRTSYLTWSTGDPITAVAVDGMLLPEAVEVPGLVMTPAQRTDVWIDFSRFGAGTEIQLRSADTFVESGMGGGAGSGGRGNGNGNGNGNGGSGRPLSLDGDVATTFIVTGDTPAPGNAPTTLAEMTSIAGDAVNADDPKVFELSTRRGAHWINDTQWDGRNATELETVGANSVELWEFANRSPMAHPMHLHGRHFEVVSRSWDDDSASESWDQINAGVIDEGRRDTVLVWPGQRVRIAVPFSDHLGYFLYHCHILEHEDAGMMRSYLVT